MNGLPYAVEMHFDPDSAHAVRELWAALTRAGVPVDEGVVPHVTLGIFGEIRPGFQDRLADFAGRMSPLDFEMASIGVFATARPVVFLAPIVASAFLAAHSEFHRSFADHRDSAWSYYLPDHWVPHCTLAMDMDRSQVVTAFDVCDRLALPMRGRFVSVGILEFKPNKQVFECPLGSEVL